MMAARPADRPQSAAEVSHALEPWAAASGSKEVVVVNAPAEEEAAEAEVDFAADPWWNSLAVAPTRAGTSPRKSGPVRAVKAAPAAKPAAKPAKAAAKDLPAKTPREAPGWLGTPRRKVAVLGGLALVVALAVGGAVMMLLSGPSQPGAVAQKSPHTDKEKAAATTATPAEDTSGKTAPPKTAPPKTAKEVFPDIQVGPATNDHGKGGGAAAPGGQPAATTAEAKQPPKTATATPAPTPPATAAAKPPAVAAAKTEPAKAAAADTKNPLGDLKASDLPPITPDADGAPVSLGPLHLAAGASLGLKLLGSEHGNNVIPKFALRKKTEAGRKENWLVAAGRAATTAPPSTSPASGWKRGI